MFPRASFSEHYRVLKRIGGGGFSRTYLAEDLHAKHVKDGTRSVCAVKQLLPRFKNEDTTHMARERFLKEAESLAKIGKLHNQIPELYAYFESSGDFFLIQEYIQGKSVQQILQHQGTLSEKQVLKVVDEVLQILVFLHERNILHRDIKPANLILRKSDRKIVLIDFGTVKNLGIDGNSAPGVDDFTLAMGTLGYAAPEQLSGRPSTGSDLYSLGMTALQALTGLEATTLPTNTQSEILWAELGVEPRLAEFLGHFVRYNWQERYSSAREALKALKAFRTGLPIPIPTQLQQHQQSERRAIRKGLGIGAGAVTLLSLIGIGSILIQQHPQFLCQSLAGTAISYGGSTTWQPIRENVEPTLQKQCSRLSLEYVAPQDEHPGSGTGIQMLLNEQVDFAQSSRPLRASEKSMASSQGYMLDAVPVVIDQVVILVHPQLAIEQLTIEQLRSIYRGEVRNWKELGGPDLAIRPYSKSPEISGTANFFQELILEGEPLGEAVERLHSQSQALTQLANSETLGAIYYASLSSIRNLCKLKTLAIGQSADTSILPYQAAPQTQGCRKGQKQTHKSEEQPQDDESTPMIYPLARQLYVIVKRDGQQPERAGEVYTRLLLDPKVQARMADVGFMPLQ